LFSSSKIKKNKKEKFKNNNNDSLFNICLTKCSKLTDRIDFYTIPYHIGKEIISRAEESQEIISLETIQHLSYVYEEEISEFPFYLKHLRIWNRILSYEQLCKYLIIK